MFKVRRALVSVSDKRHVTEFAHGLSSLGAEILSTGGTAQQLKKSGIEAIEVSAKTSFPEIMDGRVKTLHPIIHGGLLGRRGTDDSEMKEHGIQPIDLLAVNLYPFEATIKRQDSTLNEAIENIDIGGPAMIRAAAKNHEDVIVIVDPEDYAPLLEKLRCNSISKEDRLRLAAKAYAHTANYDTAITQYLSSVGDENLFNERFIYSGNLIGKLRYGENPHQSAAFYSDQAPEMGSLALAQQLQGKELSYNNISDTDAALECVKQFDVPACVIVKHANPCGVAISESIQAAYEKAFSTDPTSAFGGIIAFNRPLNQETAKIIIKKQFAEVIIAPAIEDSAIPVLAAKTNLRVLISGEWDEGRTVDFNFQKVSGGILLQTSDTNTIHEADLKVVSKKIPGETQIKDMLFAWKVASFVKSNAIVFCKDGMTIGIGAGQMSRVYSTKIAAIKAIDEGLTVENSVMASDAFFPFRDGIDIAATYGISAIIQPGGSKRDDEVIKAADDHGLAMVFTGIRHFRH
ncbi:MAG: bifunctional phosphoribosylaminoimidazolecarboxamide formyltransferase/inosine monophosphate cyclohydrolase [Woeseia sp.]|nr:bifunctional phosphoribosylaminoimidazolecarboxamide formyltransferase/inosine monophosphate cyclohydrolase [Woeseia sp.]|tara:strand:+ start:3840 stop:5390 length:1551 start_codon:yes stop_codon:yes gene_type:complete